MSEDPQQIAPDESNNTYDHAAATRAFAMHWLWLFLGLILLALAISGSGSQYIVEAGDTVRSASSLEVVTGEAQYSLPRTVGIWVAALMTLFIFSFLYRDNPLYKLAESILVGVSAAYWMVVSFWTVVVPNLMGEIAPGWTRTWTSPGLPAVADPDWYITLVPLALSIMLLWRLAPRGGWIARWPLAVVIGTTAGLRLVSFLQADFLGQVQGTVIPLAVKTEDGSWDWPEMFNNFVLVFGTLAALTYFFFSARQKGVIGGISRVGVWVLMITFGAAFASTVMGRIALLAIRFEFLLDDWLWIIDPAGKRYGM